MSLPSSAPLTASPVTPPHPTGASHGLRVAGRRGLVGRWVAALAAVALSATTLGMATTTAQADTCPNAELRALNHSSGLPDCRAYEMVTSPYKQGFAVIQPNYGDDGAVAYLSLGNFADNPYGVALFNQYVARRSATGWKTLSLNPPGEQWVFASGNGAQDGLLDGFRSSLWWMRPRSAPDERWFDHPERAGLYVRRPDGVFSLIAPSPGTLQSRVYAYTGDLSHVVLGGDYNYPAPNLYEVINGDQVLRPIGVDNTGARLPVPVGKQLCPQGMSADGRVIFVGLGTAQGDCQGLWARVGGATTIEMSASQCTRGVGDPGGVCNADALAYPAGFASDGSRAFFTTTQQLVNGDTDATNDLYVCDLPAGTPAPVMPVNVCPNLRQLSAGAAGGADVENVVRVADGSRVYFVARGVLAGNVGANDETAVAGAHNLYLWQTDAEHPAGHTTFMARLLTNEGINARTTPDNRYLLVSTPTPLVSSGPAADTDSTKDVYRYDTQTGEWLRISTDTTGNGGNAEIDAASDSGKSMTDDGRTVVFETAEALAPADTNGIGDVYAWHEGQVSLISADGGGFYPGVTSSGTDIFFQTTSQVTAADGDTNIDLYTARIGGGFDLAEPALCAGDACQGQPNATSGLVTPRSATATGEASVSDAKSTLVLKAITAAQRRSLATTGKTTLTVTTGVGGTVSAKATATISGKTTSVSSARRTVKVPGAVTLALTLSKQARAQLAVRGKLTVRVVVAHSEVAAVRSVTVKLTKSNKAKAKNAIKRPQSKRAASNVRGDRS